MLWLLILLAQAAPDVRSDRYVLVAGEPASRVPEMPVVAAIPRFPPALLHQSDANTVVLQLQVSPLGLVQDVQLLDFETAAARDAAMRAAQNWRFVARVGAAKPRPVRLEVTFRSVAIGAPPDEFLTTVRGQEWSFVVDGKIVPCPRYLVDVRGERTEAKP
jgi:TonB family protein